MTSGPTRTRVTVALGAWLILVLLVAAVLGSVNLLDYLRLSRGAAVVTGQVTSRQPLHHDMVAAEFQVGGRSYAVFKTFVVPPNPPKASLHVGDPIVVFYLPSAPRVATLGDPRHLVGNELASVLLSAILVPTLIVGVTLWRVGHARRHAESHPGGLTR